MQISIIKEVNPREQRVAASPESVKLLLRLGVDVLIEKGKISQIAKSIKK